MKQLTRKYIEGIAEKVLEAYMQLPEIKGTHVYRIDPELLLTKVLGLNIEYAHLTTDGSVLGLTSFEEVGVGVLDDTDSPMYMCLDGKTVLIEKDLLLDINHQGRKNFTIMHEGGHHIFKMLFPNDYGIKSQEELQFHEFNSEMQHPRVDWEEWQANTVAAAILLPEELIKQGMYLFGLGEKITCLNKISDRTTYERFSDLATFLGTSKQALAIRMKRLGLLEKEYLDNPFKMIEIKREV